MAAKGIFNGREYTLCQRGTICETGQKPALVESCPEFQGLNIHYVNPEVIGSIMAYPFITIFTARVLAACPLGYTVNNTSPKKGLASSVRILRPSWL